MNNCEKYGKLSEYYLSMINSILSSEEDLIDYWIVEECMKYDNALQNGKIVERGDRNASLDSLEKIIRALDIQTSDLFDFSELHVDQTNLELKDTLEVHYNFLKSKNLEDVKMIHRITKDIFKSIESK